jgi:hypothetical protein
MEMLSMTDGQSEAQDALDQLLVFTATSLYSCSDMIRLDASAKKISTVRNGVPEAHLCKKTTRDPVYGPAEHKGVEGDLASAGAGALGPDVQRLNDILREGTELKKFRIRWVDGGGGYQGSSRCCPIAFEHQVFVGGKPGINLCLGVGATGQCQKNKTGVKFSHKLGFDGNLASVPARNKQTR